MSEKCKGVLLNESDFRSRINDFIWSQSQHDSITFSVKYTPPYVYCCFYLYLLARCRMAFRGKWVNLAVIFPLLSMSSVYLQQKKNCQLFSIVSELDDCFIMARFLCVPGQFLWVLCFCCASQVLRLRWGKCAPDLSPLSSHAWLLSSPWSCLHWHWVSGNIYTEFVLKFTYLYENWEIQ